MRCNLSRVVSLAVVGAVVLASLNFSIFLISSWINSDNFFRYKHAHSIESEPLYQDILQEAPPLQPTRSCTGLGMSQTQGVTFQTVTEDQLYVYSAYLDKGTIRIIALRRMGGGTLLKCHVWYQLKQFDPLVITDVTVENLPEDHERNFTAAYIVCRLPRELQDMTPHAVSVVAGGASCADATNILQVQLPGQMTSRFTVCVTPLNFRYSRAYELVEWIELNRLLGADKFVFYNHSTGPNVDKVLELYRNEDLVDVHPWQLPMQADTWPPTGKPQVHYFAQIASLNDCLYRYQNRSRYLVYQDLDEFIIPKSYDTWAELIHDREKLHGIVSAVQFRCVFFRKEWLSPAQNFQTFVQKFKSVVLAYTRRESNFQLPGVRSKFIVNPRLVASVGVHQVWGPSHRVDHVSEDVARLHHYRNWERPNDSLRRIEDLTAVEKYGPRLVEQLEKVWSKLEGVPMDINITTYGDYV